MSEVLADVIYAHIFLHRGECACGWKMPSPNALAKRGINPGRAQAQHIATVLTKAGWRAQ